MKIITEDAILPLSRNQPHLRRDCVATRQYAYLVQQVSAIVNLSNYVLRNLFEDDAEQWFSTHRATQESNDNEQANKVEAELQLERRRTFNSIMLCQIYDAFDLYCVRMRKATSATGELRRGCLSNMDYNREVFRKKGLDFLTDENDYANTVMIKDCRNLITHNHGLVDKRFHNNHPTISDGEDTFLRVYSEELEEYVTFLTRICFGLDEKVSRKFSMERKPIERWSGPSSISREDDEE